MKGDANCIAPRVAAPITVRRPTAEDCRNVMFRLPSSRTYGRFVVCRLKRSGGAAVLPFWLEINPLWATSAANQQGQYADIGTTLQLIHDRN
jgi:hypothetical protein